MIIFYYFLLDDKNDDKLEGIKKNFVCKENYCRQKNNYSTKHFGALLFTGVKWYEQFLRVNNF